MPDTHPQILQITPFMHVADFAAAKRFFEDVLGFACLLSDGGYGYFQLGPAGIRVLEAESPDEIKPHGGFRYYVDVRDVDVVYAALKPKLDALPAGAVVGPKDQPYFQRELMIRAPDGDLFVFGSALPQPQ